MTDKRPIIVALTTAEWDAIYTVAEGELEAGSTNPNLEAALDALAAARKRRATSSGEDRLLDLSDVAEVLGLKYAAAQRRMQRGTLPAPAETVGKAQKPLWRRSQFQ